jgi:hypothetical protein
VPDLKSIDAKIISKTQKIGTAMYWLTLFANMGLVGFATPAFLNKMLKTAVQKELEQDKPKSHNPAFKSSSKVFKDFLRE